MGTSWSQVVKEKGKLDGGIAEYTRCQSATFAYSSMMMIVVSAASFGILQTKPFKPIPLKMRFVSSLSLGVFSSWYFARQRTRYCQDLYKVIRNDQVNPKKETLEELVPFENKKN